MKITKLTTRGIETNQHTCEPTIYPCSFEMVVCQALEKCGEEV